MRHFIIEQSDADFVSHSGLALVGLALNRHSGLAKMVDQQVPLRHGIAHSDVLRSYIGLLCLGKSDFEAVGLPEAGKPLGPPARKRRQAP